MFGKNRTFFQQTNILKDLQILTHIQQEPAHHSSPPTLSTAYKHLQQDFVRDSNGNKLSLWCDLTQFRKFGPGVYLMFRFIKYLLLVMGILLPLPLTSIILLITQQTKFDHTNLQTTLQSTTIQDMSSDSIIIYFNLVVTIVIGIAIIYWPHLQTNYILQCSKVACLSSYFTVVLTAIPNYYTQHQLKQYLQQHYGKVRQIYTFKNYHEDLQQYKEIYQILQAFTDQRDYLLLHRQQTNCSKLIQIFLQFRQKHQSISQQIIQHKIYEPYCAFITFQTVISRSTLLNDQKTKLQQFFNPNQTHQIQNQPLYQSQKLHFEPCEMQPDGIIWENIALSKKQITRRCALIGLILFIFLFLAITFMFIFAAAESGLYQDEYSGLQQSQLLRINTTSSIKSYCIQLSMNKFYQQPICHRFKQDYINFTILFIVFPFLITFLKMVFASIMAHIVSYRKHKDQFNKIQSQIIIITLFYFLKAGVIKFVMYRVFSIGDMHIKLLDVFMPILKQMALFMPIVPDKIPSYDDFTRQWVAHTSHKIILIAMISFNFSILIHHFSSYAVRKYRQYKAKSLKNIKKMKQILKGQQLQIQFIYAQTLSLFLFCMLYFSCMPIVYLLTYFSIFMLYWITKNKMIQFCQKPPAYAHGINTLAVKIITLGLIINCMVSPLYFANLDDHNDYNIFQRIVQRWYYLLIIITLLLNCFFRQKIVRLVIYIKNYFSKRILKNYGQNKYQDRLTTIVRNNCNMQSYSMHQNQKYNQILKILFTINKTELHKFGYFKHEHIEQIHNEVNKQQNQFKLFHELIKFIEEDERIYMHNQNNKKQEYPLTKHKQQLTAIKQELHNELEQQQKQREMKEYVHSQLKQTKAYQSLIQSGCDNKGCSQLQQMEEAMPTDVRLNQQ